MVVVVDFVDRIACSCPIITNPFNIGEHVRCMGGLPGVCERDTPYGVFVFDDSIKGVGQSQFDVCCVIMWASDRGRCSPGLEVYRDEKRQMSRSLLDSELFNRILPYTI